MARDRGAGMQMPGDFARLRDERRLMAENEAADRDSGVTVPPSQAGGCGS